MNLWPNEHFLSIFVITFWWVQQVQQQTQSTVMTNMLKKVFNSSEVHLSEVTSYKIHTLAIWNKKNFEIRLSNKYINNQLIKFIIYILLTLYYKYGTKIFKILEIIQLMI